MVAREEGFPEFYCQCRFGRKQFHATKKSECTFFVERGCEEGALAVHCVRVFLLLQLRCKTVGKVSQIVFLQYKKVTTLSNLVEEIR